MAAPLFLSRSITDSAVDVPALLRFFDGVFVEAKKEERTQVIVQWFIERLQHKEKVLFFLQWFKFCFVSDALNLWKAYTFYDSAATFAKVVQEAAIIARGLERTSSPLEKAVVFHLVDLFLYFGRVLKGASEVPGSHVALAPLVEELCLRPLAEANSRRPLAQAGFVIDFAYASFIHSEEAKEHWLYFVRSLAELQLEALGTKRMNKRAAEDAAPAEQPQQKRPRSLEPTE